MAGVRRAIAEAAILDQRLFSLRALCSSTEEYEARYESARRAYREQPYGELALFVSDEIGKAARGESWRDTDPC